MKYQEVVDLFKFLDRASRSQVPLTEWVGLPVHYDESVPPGKAELRDAKGVVLAVYTLPPEGHE